MVGDAEANAGLRGMGVRPARGRWAGLRARRQPRPPAPSPAVLETIGLALALTEHDVPAGPPIAPAEALRRLRAARDEFFGLVSHELRTPVTTIYGNARLLLDRQGGVSGELRPMLDDIVQDAERLLAIVENLLLLTRVRGGAPEDREPLPLAHLLRRSCRSFGHRRGRSVAFQGSGDARLVVEADRDHLELVIENLLGNADKFSLPDRPIEVRLERLNGDAIVRVLDRGVGVGDGSTDDLFAPFFRGPAARRVTGGMGLGLTVARRIVEAHGGRVWAMPREGGGTEVGFALPLLPDPEP
jgi:signal transduction histidine kinase